MGKIELDHTGSGSGITLSSDGTSLLLGGTAIGGGGGGADLYAANESSPSAQPSATGTNAIAIGDDSLASGLRGMAVGYSSKASGQDSSALGNATASGESSAAVGFYATASGAGSVSIGYSATASGTFAGCLGFNGKATANSAVTLGNSYASGEDSLAGAIDNNTSSYGANGANSIAMGYFAKATNPYATVSGGGNNVASGYYATVVGGSSNLADNIGSTVLGGRYGTTRGIRGAVIFGGYGNQITATQGTSQSGLYILAEQTTDATATDLKTDNQSSSSTANQIVLPNGGAYAFTGTIVGREAASSGTECAAWKVEGLIRREANAGSTVLVNSSTTVLNNAPSWGMALSANTSLGCLKIEVTGAAKTIRWVGTITTTELTYA
jgi:hypothetical protein